MIVLQNLAGRPLRDLSTGCKLLPPEQYSCGRPAFESGQKMIESRRESRPENRSATRVECGHYSPQHVSMRSASPAHLAHPPFTLRQGQGRKAKYDGSGRKHLQILRAEALTRATGQIRERGCRERPRVLGAKKNGGPRAPEIKPISKTAYARRAREMSKPRPTTAKTTPVGSSGAATVPCTASWSKRQLPELLL